ncbi:MAG TPA: choice-of-anchor B family protein [Flavobacteriales bacterium]
MLIRSSHKLPASSLKPTTTWTKLVACGLWLISLASATAQDSLNMRALGRWHDDALPATFFYDNTYNAVWGYARDGREYGIIGSTMGTHIIDVTDPTQPVEAVFIPGAYQGENVIHREFKTYRDRLYAVTDEGPGTLQIMDLTQLPDAAPVVYDSDALFQRAHSIWIDTTEARLYTHAGSSDFAIWSLADPDSPTLLLKPQLTVPWWGNVGLVHDAYEIGNIAYLNDIDAMHIIDLNNVAAPQLIGSITQWPQPGYNHSGWLHDNGWLYVMADETHGTDIKLFDVGDPGDIEFLDTIGTDLGPGSIAHNPCFKGDELHVSWYYDGYWLWSVADPNNAVLLGYYDTHPEPYDFSYKGAWGVYPYLPSGNVLVSDMQRGLYIIDISQALSVNGPSGAGRELRTWPNPATDAVNIGLPAGERGPFHLHLRDASGRLLNREVRRAGHATALQLDTRHLDAGTYLVEVSNARGSWTSRFIKTFAP